MLIAKHNSQADMVDDYFELQNERMLAVFNGIKIHPQFRLTTWAKFKKMYPVRQEAARLRKQEEELYRKRWKNARGRCGAHVFEWARHMARQGPEVQARRARKHEIFAAINARYNALADAYHEAQGGT